MMALTENIISGLVKTRLSRPHNILLRSCIIFKARHPSPAPPTHLKNQCGNERWDRSYFK